MKINLIACILFILFYLPAFWQVFPQSSIQEKLDKILSNSFFESTLAAVDVYDLTGKEIIYQKNNRYLLHPASNMKILTSAAGLVFLGPDFNFETTFYYKGDIDDGVLDGNLYVVGGFDPAFSIQDLDYFIDAIDSLGIKKIKGNIFADVSRMDTMYWGEGWMWDDDPSTDSPYLSSLNINYNSVEVFLLGTEPGRKAQIILNPYSKYFNVYNEAVTVSPDEDNSYSITRDWMNKKNTVVAKGKVKKGRMITGDEEPQSLNVFRPDLYFLTLFKETLQRKGIKVEGKSDNFWLPYDAIYLRTISRPFAEIIIPLDKKSINLIAEMVLYALAEKYYGKPATAKNGIKVINNFISLIGMSPEKYNLVDGSGLSHYNLVSAELILEVLKYMYYSEPGLYKVLVESFPIAGVDGTLAKRMNGTSAENNVKAKTGTITGVSALSGYITSQSGRLIAFSILIENFARGTSTARNFQDEICKILVEY
ncbi:MAG: D-alanyl-D-alanine carboxypeptidase/D-alanyl-D-alanine-endopeptidase [Ignavibacteria bacterium RIFOXYB2_FULL_36_7]|nr:MAG: D-alanyl-D-alanine carboxypeptidase/D-alanyl-D-alanine-endopeptidase [Ignavibacteria bacterium RIFOXYB2_FULL_36_7]